MAVGITAGVAGITGITTGGGVLALGLDDALMPPAAATMVLGLPCVPVTEDGVVV